MRNIAKIALIVFALILEIGYADDCRKELYKKYKAHSAEFIKLKNKCKPLLEKAGRLADTYKNMLRNMVEYKEFEAIQLQWSIHFAEWGKSREYKEAERVYGECYLPTECYRGDDGFAKYEEMRRKEEIPLNIEINTTCKLFLDGVYDIDKAFERIARAEYEFERRREEIRVHYNSASLPPCVNYDRCQKGYYTAFKEYIAEYDKALKAAEKALDKAKEPLLTALINSPEVKEYEAECRGITFPAYEDINIKYFDVDWFWFRWGDYEEEQIISYIKSIIANRQ